MCTSVMLFDDEIVSDPSQDSIDTSSEDKEDEFDEDDDEDEEDLAGGDEDEE